MKFLNESEYKLNDCKWLNRLPGTWDSKRLKYVSKVKPSNVDKKTEENEIPVSLCNYNEVYKNDFIDSSLTFMEASASSEEIAKFQIIKDDVIITKDSETPEEIALPAYVVENLPNTLCGYHLSLIRTDKNVLSGSYLFRLFQSKQFNAQFTVAANGITRFGLDTYSIKNAVVALPSLPEQRTIAKFLDYKTTQIDALIEKKEQLLKLLEEKRIALITNAVTGKLSTSPPWRGLRGGSQLDKHNNVTMKPSGIPWLGEIPKHWEVKRLRSLMKGKLSNGIFKKRDDWGLGTKLINVSDIYTNNFLVNTSNLTLVNCSDEELETYRVKDGDFFFVRSSLKLEGIGQSSSLIGNNEELVFECHLVKGSPNQLQINARFLNYFLNSSALRNYFISHANTVTMSTIDQSVFKDTILCVPTLLEQQYIVEHLDIELAKIDQLSSKVTAAIEKLKEYRTSLITSAVTGKIDLRNWQIE